MLMRYRVGVNPICFHSALSLRLHDDDDDDELGFIRLHDTVFILYRNQVCLEFISD